MKIAFLGTPEFAIPSLTALQKSRHKIVCVITQPDAPGGRGQKLAPPPAKQFALEHNIPVFQPENISRDLGAILAQLPEKPDILITCAYGQILKQNVLDAAPHGVINVHASILPRWRGACPVNYTLINGDRRTGVTIMQTALGLDTGDIILQQGTRVTPHETAGELTARLALIGAAVLVKALAQIENGTAKHTPQDNTKATRCRMLKKSDGKIDFSKSPREVVNFIRGMNPWPGAYAPSTHGAIIVHSAHVVSHTALELDIVQSPGGRKISYKDFLNGHKNFQFK